MQDEATLPDHDSINDRLDPFVMSLRRTPERLAAFARLNRGKGLRFGTMAAIDGQTLDRGVLQRRRLIAPDLTLYTPGALGCALSHRALWSRAVKTGRTHVVFEDDAVLRADIATALPTIVDSLDPAFDLILLGYNTNSVLETELFPDCVLQSRFSLRYPSAAQLAAFAADRRPVSAHRLRHAFGTCGYVVSAAGAQKLLQACFPLDNRPIAVPLLRRSSPAWSIDSLMNDVYRRIAAYACVPPLVLVANEQSASTTVAQSSRVPSLAGST